MRIAKFRLASAPLECDVAMLVERGRPTTRDTAASARGHVARQNGVSASGHGKAYPSNPSPIIRVETGVLPAVPISL